MRNNNIKDKVMQYSGLGELAELRRAGSYDTSDPDKDIVICDETGNYNDQHAEVRQDNNQEAKRTLKDLIDDESLPYELRKELENLISQDEVRHEDAVRVANVAHGTLTRLGSAGENGGRGRGLIYNQVRQREDLATRAVQVQEELASEQDRIGREYDETVKQVDAEAKQAMAVAASRHQDMANDNIKKEGELYIESSNEDSHEIAPQIYACGLALQEISRVVGDGNLIVNTGVVNSLVNVRGAQISVDSKNAVAKELEKIFDTQVNPRVDQVVATGGPSSPHIDSPTLIGNILVYIKSNISAGFINHDHNVPCSSVLVGDRYTSEDKERNREFIKEQILAEQEDVKGKKSQSVRFWKLLAEIEEGHNNGDDYQLVDVAQLTALFIDVLSEREAELLRRRGQLKANHNNLLQGHSDQMQQSVDGHNAKVIESAMEAADNINQIAKTLKSEAGDRKAKGEKRVQDRLEVLNHVTDSKRQSMLETEALLSRLRHSLGENTDRLRGVDERITQLVLEIKGSEDVEGSEAAIARKEAEEKEVIQRLEEAKGELGRIENELILAKGRLNQYNLMTSNDPNISGGALGDQSSVSNQNMLNESGQQLGMSYDRTKLATEHNNSQTLFNHYIRLVDELKVRSRDLNAEVLELKETQNDNLKELEELQSEASRLYAEIVAGCVSAEKTQVVEFDSQAFDEELDRESERRKALLEEVLSRQNDSHTAARGFRRFIDKIRPQQMTKA